MSQGLLLHSMGSDLIGKQVLRFRAQDEIWLPADVTAFNPLTGVHR